MKQRNILLLNPPSDKLCIRDYYCSKVSKADYIYQPIDLLILSGTLGQRHRVNVLDCIAQKVGYDECLNRITGMKVDTIIFLTGSVSWEQDFKFLNEVKKATGALMVGSGDVLLEGGTEKLREIPFLDAVLLDFTTADILRFLDGELEKIRNMVFRSNGDIIKKEEREKGLEFEIPVPRHELFHSEKYSFPFVRRHPFATVLTDYGCPYKCSFCVMSTIGYKYRSVANILSELQHLARLGFKDIYFGDQTFAARRRRTLELCNAMAESKLDFGWVCWSRVDLIDEEILTAMKRAGCHTIMFGVETANEKILKETRKGFGKNAVMDTFKLCRKLDVRTLATFIIGLPGEDRASCMETIEFAKEIDCDFASFNVPVPRMRTELRKQAVENSWVQEDFHTMDQSGSYPIMDTDVLTKEEIWALKNTAIKEFYLRPSYLLKRMSSVRTRYEFERLIYNGFATIKGVLSKQTDTDTK